MKKQYALWLCVLTLCLSSCGTRPEPESKAESPDVPPAAEETSALTETAAPAETTAPETEPAEPYHWVVEPQFSYDFAGVILKGHVTYTENGYSNAYLDCNTVWHNPFCVYGVDGKFGVTDYAGTVITPPEYDEIRVGIGEKCILENWSTYRAREVLPDGTLTEPVDWEEYQEVTNGWPQVYWNTDQNCICGNSEGFVDPSPVEALTIYPVQQGHETRNEEFDYSYFEADWDGPYALASNDKLITDFIYEDAGRYHEGIIPVKKDGKWGYVDANGETVIPFAYDDSWEKNRSMMITDGDSHYPYWSAYDATEGTIVLCQDGAYALYSTAGEEIIPFGELEEISPLYQGKAWAKSGGKWGVIELGAAVPDAAPDALTAETPEAPAASETAAQADRTAIIDAYRETIMEKVSVSKSMSGSEDYMMDYTLADLDADGIPELAVKYGTCEADFQVDVYAFRDGTLQEIGSGIPGGHATFAWDPAAGQFVMTGGHMGYGFMYWYALGEDGKLTEVNYLDGSVDDSGQDFYAEHPVDHLPCSSSYRIGDTEKTYIFCGDAEGDELPGLDLSFLTEYQF